MLSALAVVVVVVHLHKQVAVVEQVDSPLAGLMFPTLAP